MSVLNESLITILLVTLVLFIGCESDETAPIVNITSPIHGSTVRGRVTIHVKAADKYTVERVEFYIDGVLMHSANHYPREYSWDTEDYADGNQHNILVKGYDTSHNIGFSKNVIVTVPSPNTSPLAKFTMKPESGTTHTLFRFDASRSSDVEDAPTVIQVRWKFESDWESEFSNLKTTSYQFDRAGDYKVFLEVKDSGGLLGSTEQTISVMAGVGEVRDVDGNVYKTIKIGDQVWMAENLRVTNYINGDAIKRVQNDSEWGKMVEGGYCSYLNNLNIIDTLGFLYNWYAIDDKRKIVPMGWHIPTDEEWKKLEAYLGMSRSNADNTDWRGDSQGAKMKSVSGWLNNQPGNNVSGFNALPGGYRYYSSGSYGNKGSYGYFWSSTEEYSFNAWCRVLSYSSSKVERLTKLKNSGFSVRCVKD